MAERDRPAADAIKVTDVDDPFPDASFGTIGRYVEVAHPDGSGKPFAPQLLTVGFDEEQAGHVDLSTLTLFEVDPESREFTPLDSSRVDLENREVTAWVDHDGTYGLIGLPTDPAVVETIRLLDRYESQLVDEREQGEHGLQDRICGLILCGDPTPFGGGAGAGDLCGQCLGLDPTFGRLPDKYLLERQPPIRDLHRFPPGPTLKPLGTPNLLAWGDNHGGNLGDGTMVDRLTPVFVAGLDVKKIVGAEQFTLALATNGTVWSWGMNSQGELGSGTRTSRSSPVQVPGLTNIVDIAAGFERALAVDSFGTVYEWGLRDTFGGASDLTPQPIGVSNGVAVAAGYAFNLVLTRNPMTGVTEIWAWGENSFGQLGDGTRMFRSSPRLVSGLTGVSIRSIAAGGSSSFAVKSNGDVLFWGLGIGINAAPSTPTPLPGLNNIEQVSVEYHAAARDTAGDVWVWGPGDDGASGDGTANFHWPPVQVPGLHQVTALASGDVHHVALRGDGSVWTWGYNRGGQIGDGSTADRLSPFQVPLPAGRNANGVGAGPNWSFATLG